MNNNSVIKKTIQGHLFNRIETLGGKEFNHIGFENKNGTFGDMLASFVPKIGMKKKAKLTIEIIEDKQKN